MAIPERFRVVNEVMVSTASSILFHCFPRYWDENAASLSVNHTSGTSEEGLCSDKGKVVEHSKIHMN